MLKSTSARQGAHKRTIASVYHLFDVEDKSSMLQYSDQLNEGGSSFILTNVEGKDVHISSLCGLPKGDGLMRSQSFPPEGWYKTSSKYILRIRKAWNSEDLEGHRIDCGNKLEDLRRRLTNSEPEDVSLGGASPMAVDPACAPDLVPEQQVHSQRIAPDSASKPPLPRSSMAGLLPSSCDSPARTSGKEDINVHHLTSQTCDEVDKAQPLPSRCHSSATTSQNERNDTHSVVTSQTRDVVDMAQPISSTPPVVEKCTSGEGLLPVSVIPASGKLLVCGRRREMEDTAAIVPSFLSEGRDDSKLGKQAYLDWHFYAVYDGHGGSQASLYCGERLHQVVAEELLRSKALVASEGEAANDPNMEWEEIMKNSFAKIDEEVGGVCPNKGSNEDDADYDGGCLCCEDAVAPENVGTTAVVALVGLHQVVVANCGDSRAVLARGGQAIPLSRDHKPELDDETRRIEAAGGRVIAWDGFRVGGLLAVSRSIGDRYLKRYVISEPETICLQRTADDECLILASDGLWDVVSSDLACEVARKSLPALRRKYASRSCAAGEDAAAAAVAALLVKLAYGKGSKDNITVVVVDLKSRMRSRRS